jgi:catechol 2,3-dioxygenase-like lactoylglutathione lyase family enzyme
MERARGITHVGLTVPDLEAGIGWYRETLGWGLTFGPVELKTDASFTGRQIEDVFGRPVVRFRVAHLDPGGETVVELFEFSEPRTEGAAGFEFWRPGVFHLCLVVDEIDETAAAIAAAGGSQNMPVQPIIEGERFLMCYCADPFGNIIELYSHPHREIFATRAGY